MPWREDSKITELCERRIICCLPYNDYGRRCEWKLLDSQAVPVDRVPQSVGIGKCIAEPTY